MSLLFKFGNEARIKSRSGQFLLLSSALWSMACVQAEAGAIDPARLPLVVHAAIAPASSTPVSAASVQTISIASGSMHQLREAAAANSAMGDVTLDFVDADISDVLKALAVQTGVNIVSGADVKGTITVSLAHVTLDQALDMVARLSGFQYAKVGSTYVVGTAGGVNTLMGSGTDNEPVTAVVPYTYSTAKDLGQVLHDRFPNLAFSAGDPTTASKVGAGFRCEIITGDAATVSEARALIQQIDIAEGANQASLTTAVYQVKYASISDLQSILASLVPSVTVTIGPQQGFSGSASGGSSGDSGSESGASSSGSGSSSGSSGGSSSSSSSSSASSSGGTTSNILLLTGSAADIAKAQQILAQVDVQPAQIDFEAKVTEITDTKLNDLGLNWNFSGATTRIGEQPDNIATPPPTLGQNGQSNLLNFGAIGRTAVSDLATVSLDALIQNGNARLLANPNISAIDGQPAQVFIGNTINYVQSITQTTTGEDVTTGSVQVGVILRVTGKVGADGYITLTIHPEVSEITGYLSVPGGGSLPQVASRYADTTVRVKNGETIAIGGLIQENDTWNVNKVPGLGDLPFVGKLFQDNQLNKSKDQVVFLLTTRLAS